jgi:hypothetical protein
MRATPRRPRLARRLKRAATAVAVTAVIAGSLAASGLVTSSSHDSASAVGPNVTCTTSPDIYNTGYNSGTGGELTSGTDPNWQVSGPYGTTSFPSTATTWSNVATTTGWGIQPPPASTSSSYKPFAAANVGNAAPGQWYDSPYNNANWISQESTGAKQAGPGPSWYYKYDFTLDPQITPSTYAVKLDFYADNSVAEVYVNGVAQSTSAANAGKLPQGTDPLGYNGYLSGAQSSVLLDHGWQTGQNSIVVQIYSAPGNEGFLTQATAPAACSYTVAKTVDNHSPHVGDKVTYSVTVTNTGSSALPYWGMTDPIFVDDLSGVLDDASYDNDASNGAVFDSNAKTLSWTGAVPGYSSQTITYSVTVKAGGDGSVHNSVTVPASNGIYSTTCAPAQPCSVTSTVVNTVAAVDDTAQPVTVGATNNTNVRANDTSATGAALANPVLTSAQSVHHNAVSVLPDGTVDYVAAPGFSGADSYTYTVCDTSTPAVCGPSPATVSIVVDNVFSNGPGATGGSTPQNTPKTFSLADLATTTGSSLDPTAVSQLVAPTHGSIVINPTTGDVTYTPTAGYTGADSYQVTVCDTSSPVQCHPVTVSLNVGANTVTANPDTQSVAAGGTVTNNVVAGDSSGGVADTSASGTPLNPAITILTPPAHGTATPHSDGTITYVPTAGFSGADSYSYRVCDTSTPTPVCATGPVSVSVLNGFITPDGPGTPGTPDGPGGSGAASAATPQNTPHSFALSDLISTTGRPINPASITQVGTAPHGGTITIDTTSGAVVYTPAAGYTGPDSFVLNMCDTATPTSCYSVTTTMTVGANVVTAKDDFSDVTVGQPAVVPVMANDTSRTGQPLDPSSVTIVTQPSDGSVAVGTGATGSAPLGSVTYTPNSGFSGRDVFSYRVCDTSSPTPVCSTAQVTMTASLETLAFTGAQGVSTLLIAGVGVFAVGIVLLIASLRRRRAKGMHKSD